MYQVSEALDKVISGSGRTFYARLNGISDGIQEIVQTNFSTPDSYFYVGGAIASKIEASMFTKTQEFVKGTEVRFEIGAMVDSTIEWIPMGYFTIKEQKKDRNLLTFTAYDRLESKLAKAYKSKIVKYPVESKEFLADISEQTGVEFDTSKLSDILIIDKILTVNDQSGEKSYKEPFDGFTMQQVVGYIAQLHGTFAICDRNGKVTFKWYEALTTDHPGKIGDTAGSYLKDQNLSFIYNTIEFLKESHTYLIKTNRYFDDLLQSETMCQISGISCDTENNHYESGTNINTNLSNPVMTQEWLNKILKKIKDMSYYPVSFSFMGDPRLDVGDVVTIVDAKNNLIDVPVMQHTITFDGGLLSEVASYGFEEKETKSPSEIALQRVKDDVLSLQEITAKKATFNQLNAVDAKITNLQASAITTNTANILYARLDKANIEYGWITTVMIGDAQITDAKIQGLTASKLTAGTIDASNINVLNLNASNITVGKINGKQLSDEINNNITNSLNNSNNALSTANNAIQVVKIEYYSSTSKNETTGGSWTENTPEWIEGRYIWSRTKTITKIGGVTYSDEACITGNTGAKGDKGDQGVQGVKGADGKTYYTWVKYADSATSGMSDNPSGKKYIGFAYNKSTVTESTNYSDYAWSLIKGDTGPQGVKGNTGATGNGIKSITYYYAKTTTQTAPSASSVTATAMPQLDATNKYLWQKEVITYTNNQTQTSVLLLAVYGNTGAKGDKGDQGVQGVKGADGKTYYTWVKYADSATSGMSDNPSGKKYIGFAYNKSTVTESTNYSDYAWSLIKGDTGPQGVKGNTGATGNGIKSITYYYAKTTTQTAPSASSVTATAMPQLDATNKYLWQKEVITYTNNQTQTSVLLLAVYGNTGAKGDKGDQGVQGVKGADGKTYYTWVKYADSATSGMSDNPSGKKYIGFAYNKSTVTESTNYSDYAWSLIKGDTGPQGVKGNTGATGNGIKSITYYYAKTTTQTAPSASSVTATAMPQLDATNKYLWQKEVITYTNNQTQTSVLLLAVYGNTGAKGDKGDQGVQGVKGADGKTYYTWVKYADSATSGMSDNPSGKKYIGFAYNKSTVTESTNYSDYAWSLIKGDTGPQGVKGNTGATGNGIKSITYYYAKTTTQTAPSASSVTATAMPQLDATNKYLWQKEVITYTNNQTQTSVLLLAVYGNTGAKGDKGDQGVQGKGVKSIKGQYYLSSSKTSLVGGTWSDTQPTWTEGSYIWTRSYIVWSDDTITTTTPILANALNAANSVANTALSTADGKNAVFYQASQPSTAGRKTNDVWYDTGNENAMYYFNGKSWVKKEFGNNALDNISASKITAGTLDAKKVTLINLDASSITTGTITGLDAIFNRSFKVDSPYSDTDSFVIESSSNGVTIATRTKGVVSSTNDNKMFLGNDGLDIRCGTGPMRIWANDILTIRTDSAGQINLEVQGLNSPNPPVYVKSDAGAFKIYHEGNFGSSASYKTGLKIGSITQGSSVTDFYVPLATTSASGLISADEKKKINVDYLPKSGGTIDNPNVNVLGLNCTSGTMSTLRFYGSGKRLGSVGFNAQNSSLYRWNTSGTAYRILDENDLPLMADSGWVNITLGSGITAVSYIGARVRKIGNIVNVVMGVTGATAAFQTLGTLAQGYRPSKEINLAARYYNSPTTAIAIGTDGTIKVLQTSSGGSSYNASGAISFSITYFI